MINTLLGSKEYMGQTYVEGTRVPFTSIKLGSCVVTQVKTIEKNGYNAIQLGFGQKRIKNTKKPQKGHLKSVIKGKFLPRFLREVKIENTSLFKVGDEIKLTDVFKKGDLVSVKGVTKGKGFAGVVKRWSFAGGPKTHGQSDRHRAPGSIGQRTTPGRVYKGKRMAGRMGSDTFTLKNLIIVDVNKDDETIQVSGPVPGTKESLLIVKKLASGMLEELVEEAPEIIKQQENLPDEETTAKDELKEDKKDEN